MVQDDAIQAFNINHFKKGLLLSFKALLKKPTDLAFLRHVLYHLKRAVIRL
jgi:hypothetical protein